MAVSVITPIVLVLNTATIDHADADASAMDGTDGADVAAAKIGKNQLVLLKFVDDGTGSTVTIQAGDNPPSMTAGLGNITITLAASDVKYIAVEQARVTQSDGKIHASSTDAGPKITAFVLPTNA